MRERPILFIGDMVRAILEGRKTVTRRTVKSDWIQSERAPLETSAGVFHFWCSGEFACPYGLPGDRLWVRETWCDVNLYGAPGLAYRADGDIRDLMAEPCFLDADGAFDYSADRVKAYGFAVWCDDLLSGAEGRWRPSIHMPRWASRILLEITAVRVERLQDITEEQAIAEGIDLDALADAQDRYDMVLAGSGADGRATPITAFRDLWNSTGGDWDANPWVWVIEFKRVEASHA